MQLCECNFINVHLKVKTGGTMMFQIATPILCSQCHKPLRKCYYSHQCLRVDHSLCYTCLIDKGICRKCQHYYKCMV